MNKLTPNFDSHCYQNLDRDDTKPINQSNLENARIRIIRILEKTVLCHHDVNDLKKILHSNLSDLNHLILEIKKQAEIKLQNISSSHVMSFFYLQRLQEEQIFKEVKLNISFQEIHSKYKEKTQAIDKEKEVASAFPLCFSDKDVKLIFGKSIDFKIKKILEEKREQFLQATKSELTSLSKQDPKKYPIFLNNLANTENTSSLFLHIFNMKKLLTRQDRASEIKKMTFLELSNRILEIREIIIQHVKKSIPVNSKNVVFLLGPTGAGKSTTLCYLLGDQMILNGTAYASMNDVNNHLIGKSYSGSCTFLPNVKIRKDRGIVFVDFPGFEDSNGLVVGLGIELALKALIKEYSPKILILESILDTGQRFKSASDLRDLLNRILEEPEKCIMGITKYSQIAAYQVLKEIKKNLALPSPEETTLISRIQVLEEDLLEDPQNELKKQRKQTCEEKLKYLQLKRNQDNQLALANLPRAKIHIDEIEEMEAGLENEIGLKKTLSFSDLEDQKILESYLDILTDTKSDSIIKSVKVNSKNRIDAHAKEILIEIFRLDLADDLKSHKPYSVDLKDMDIFIKKINSHSLVYTIANPRIGEFLHLPEMDPEIVKYFDKEIVKDCISKYIRAVVGGFNVSILEKLLKEKEEKSNLSEKDRKIRKKINNYKKFIISFGESPVEDETALKKQWEDIENEYQAEETNILKGFEIHTLTKVFLIIPFGIPYAIRELWKNKKTAIEKRRAMENILTNHLDDYLSTLNQTKKVLKSLKEIKTTIEGKVEKKSNE